MQKLKVIERNNREYAKTIEEILTRPYTNEQLVSLLKRVVVYLNYTADVVETEQDLLSEQNKRFRLLLNELCKLAQFLSGDAKGVRLSLNPKWTVEDTGSNPVISI